MERMEKGLTWVAATRRSEPELTSGRSHLEDTGQNRSQLRETNVEDIISPYTHIRRYVLPSGLQPCSMRVSGHSQVPVAGLYARPGSQGWPLCETSEQAPVLSKEIVSFAT